MKRLGLLALVTMSVWVLAAVPANMRLAGSISGLAKWDNWRQIRFDRDGLLVALIAAAVCLVPASLTLLLIDLLRKRTPVERVVATLAAPFIRMILAGGGGMVLFFVCPLIHDHDRGFPFITWMVVFYLATLAVETRLLYIDTTASAEAESSN